SALRGPGLRRLDPAAPPAAAPDLEPRPSLQRGRARAARAGDALLLQGMPGPADGPAVCVLPRLPGFSWRRDLVARLWVRELARAGLPGLWRTHSLAVEPDVPAGTARDAAPVVAPAAALRGALPGVGAAAERGLALAAQGQARVIPAVLSLGAAR